MRVRLVRVQLSLRTASTWMRLAALGITAEDVIARGGISATLKRKSATVADLPGASDAPDVSVLQRELAEVEAAIGGAQRGYYDALNRRQRRLRALARRPGTEPTPLALYRAGDDGRCFRRPLFKHMI